MDSASKLFHVYGPSLIATAIGSATVIWQTNKGNDGVKAEIEGNLSRVEKNLESKIEDLRAEVQDLGAEVQDLGAEVQACQSMILQTAHHTMKALDGNKKPMREWLHKLERCKQSGGEDCGSIPKA